MKGMKHPSAPWLFFFLACCGAVLAVDLLVSGCQKPIPYTPEQRQDWYATDPAYPDMHLGTVRDAGIQ